MASPLNFHRLRIFYTVARLGSFSRAAEELSISQPAVSIQVQAMERSMGAILFHRRRRDHQLTETGRIVYDYAQRLFALANEMQQVLDDLQGVRAGTLTLGASTTPGEYILPTLIGRFQRQFPGVEVSLHIHNSQAIVQQIQRRELDLAVVGAQVEDPELVVEPYVLDEIVVIAAPSHPLAQESPVPLRALENHPFILREEGSATRRTAEADLQARDVRVKVAMEMGSNEALKRAVASGSALGLVSRYAIGPELAASLLTVVPVKGWRCTRPLSIIYRQDKHLTSAQEAFLTFLREEQGALLPEVQGSGDDRRPQRSKGRRRG
jgi:DNA-binding transcriptional LysR family regulator